MFLCSDLSINTDFCWNTSHYLCTLLSGFSNVNESYITVVITIAIYLKYSLII